MYGIMGEFRYGANLLREMTESSLSLFTIKKKESLLLTVIFPALNLYTFLSLAEESFFSSSLFKLCLTLLQEK